MNLLFKEWREFLSFIHAAASNKNDFKSTWGAVEETGYFYKITALKY